MHMSMHLSMHTSLHSPCDLAGRAAKIVAERQDGDYDALYQKLQDSAGGLTCRLIFVLTCMLTCVLTCALAPVQDSAVVDGYCEVPTACTCPELIQWSIAKWMYICGTFGAFVKVHFNTCRCTCLIIHMFIHMSASMSIFHVHTHVYTHSHAHFHKHCQKPLSRHGPVNRRPVVPTQTASLTCLV